MPKHFFQKGNTYGKGRPKGCQNKVNTNFKEAFMIVFERMGGWKGLYRWGIENPNIFYPLIAKMVPQKSMIDLDFRLSHEDWVRKIAEFHRNKLSEDEENVAIESKQAAAIPEQVDLIPDKCDGKVEPTGRLN